jgi:anaerobic magnesium-protoporphyrin IX monomethyl ester cyclase
VDVMLVNPPTPDGGIWIRSQHRVGRRSRENMIWPQVSLAQLAALLSPTYSVRVVDANAERMSWPAFEQLLRRERPKYYVTQLTAPTLQNDLYGTFLAKTVGATTMAFGTHLTPMPRETLRPFPSLDFGLRGEPDLTLRDLVDHLEGNQFDRPANIETMFRKHDAAYSRIASSRLRGRPNLGLMKGLVWRHGDEIVVNPDRPFIADLDDLPMPILRVAAAADVLDAAHQGPVLLHRDEPGLSCRVHLLHQARQLRSDHAAAFAGQAAGGDPGPRPAGGAQHPHVCRPVHGESGPGGGLCRAIIDAGLKIRWTCNSRVDFVDQEMLQLMAKSGCYYIAWGLESGTRRSWRTRARAWIRTARGSRCSGARGGHQELGLLHHRPCRAKPRRRSSRRSPSPRACRSTSRSSTLPRRIRARRSSTKW